MTAINYYRWSLLQPVLLTALALPSVVKDPVASGLIFIFSFLGLQYAVWSVYALRRLRGKGEADARQFASRAPVHLALLTLPVCVVFGAYLLSSLDAYYTNKPATFFSVIQGALFGLASGALVAAPVTIIVVHLWVAYINFSLELLKRLG